MFGAPLYLRVEEPGSELVRIEKIETVGVSQAGFVPSKMEKVSILEQLPLIITHQIAIILPCYR